MVRSLVKNLTSWLVLVIVLSVTQCESKKCGVICRVRDPLAIGSSHMLKECLYEVYPVESTQSGVGAVTLHDNAESRNRLFSLYGGPSSCEYFGNMIQTAKGRETLVETIGRQLQKCGFKGLDLQCDPVQARVSQQTYADFIEELRSSLGNTYVLMVTMANCQPEPRLVESLNRAVDFVTINPTGQSSTLSNALMFGLARHRVLLVAPFPNAVQCPLNSDYALNEVLNHIEHHNLFGAVVHLDQDDVNNVCGEGPFPLFRKVLDRLCPDTECNFSGFVRDTRDCAQYYSCENGYKKPHQCPSGYSFDLCKSSCEPFLQVNCNSTTCLMSGSLPHGLIPIPCPIPVPMPNLNCSVFGNCGNTGGNNSGNNGGNNCCNGAANTTNDCCCQLLKNLTVVLNGTGQFSELVQLLIDSKIDDLVGVLRRALKDLIPLLNSLIGPINDFLRVLLLGGNAVNATTSGVTMLGANAGLLSNLIETIIKLLGIGADGSPLGLLGGLLGGAAPASTGAMPVNTPTAIVPVSSVATGTAAVPAGIANSGLIIGPTDVLR